ncbi:MAG TPA: potassium channel family protein [Actinomycetota bacterium]|nr:potassium channel family protein [Actinomycetota bacterium]
MRSWRWLTGQQATNRYGVVLLLLGVCYVTSVSSSGTGGITVVMLVQLLTLWLTFSASESRRAQRIAGVACLAMGALVLAVTVFGLVLELSHATLRWIALISVVVYLLAPLVILRHLVRRTVVDLRTVLGAVAAYVMLGMMFAFTYRAISLWQTSPAFFGGDGPGDNADFLFFSFITLTTTGYGDLVPAANPGQSVAVLEAVIGQLFLVTALAKIVNAWRLPGSPPASPLASADDAPPPGT